MYKQEQIKPYEGTGEKGKLVEEMFDNIAPTYDTLNHRLSWDIDKGWRKKAIKRLAPFSPKKMLDIASTENQCLLVERLDERFDALGETDDITVVSLEDSLVAFMLHFYHVDRSDGICLGANQIKITDYLFLVRDGYIEAF